MKGQLTVLKAPISLQRAIADGIKVGLEDRFGITLVNLLSLYSLDARKIPCVKEVTIEGLARQVLDAVKRRQPEVADFDPDQRINFVPYDQAYAVGFEDMQRRVPGISKITGLIGWVPRRSLADILEDVITYESQVG